MRVWRRVLGVEHTVIEWVDLEPDGRVGEVLVAQVRPKAGVAWRCSRCGRRCAGYDTSTKPRRWRGLDLGSTQVFLQATTLRLPKISSVQVMRHVGTRGGCHRGVRAGICRDD